MTARLVVVVVVIVIVVSAAASSSGMIPNPLVRCEIDGFKIQHGILVHGVFFFFFFFFLLQAIVAFLKR